MSRPGRLALHVSCSAFSDEQRIHGHHLPFGVWFSRSKGAVVFHVWKFKMQHYSGGGISHFGTGK